MLQTIQEGFGAISSTVRSLKNVGNISATYNVSTSVLQI